VIDEAVDAHTANEHRLLAALTASDRQVLADLLRRLLLQFEDHLEPTESRRPTGVAGGLSGRSSPRRSAGAGR
jgi:hypothetical protein